jgi:hypothetical protein
MNRHWSQYAKAAGIRTSGIGRRANGTVEESWRYTCAVESEGIAARA